MDCNRVKPQDRDSLVNAISQASTMNYGPILQGFSDKGIPVDAILPRENVFTFNAGRALGRVVRAGEKGVAIVTFVKCRGRVSREAAVAGEAGAGGVRPIRTHVFHVSQTDPLAAVSTH